MWHDIKKTRQKLWIWQALERETGQRLDWACGRRDKATWQTMVGLDHRVGYFRPLRIMA